MENKYVGYKFFDCQGNALEVMERYNEKFYLVKSPFHNWEIKCGELMTDEDIEELLQKQDKIKAYLERRKKREEEAERAAKVEERKRIEKENLYGYDANMTDMQRGKVLKTLSMTIVENGIVMARKDFIKRHIEAGAYAKKIDGVTNFYGNVWERKETKPRTEYRFYNEDDKSFRIITKTEYDFANYIARQVIAE